MSHDDKVVTWGATWCPGVLWVMSVVLALHFGKVLLSGPSLNTVNFNMLLVVLFIVEYARSGADMQLKNPISHSGY